IDYTLFILSRYKSALKDGKDVDSAIDEAMSTAGIAVFSAGITVVISILGILIVNLDYLNGIAIGVSLCIFFMIIMALTLVPALLATRLGRNLDKFGFKPKEKKDNKEHGWLRWSHFVQKNAVLSLCAGIA